MKELNEDSRMLFYKKWAALRAEKEYLALDITSISSWSELIQYVEPGYNRDHEQLPQVNPAMLFGEDSKLPVFSRADPGSVKDVSTLLGLTVFIEKIELEQMHFVMGKGFYSEKGIAPLLENISNLPSASLFQQRFAALKVLTEAHTVFEYVKRLLKEACEQEDFDFKAAK